MYRGTKSKRYKRMYSDHKFHNLPSVPGPSTLFDSETCMYPSRDILYICDLVDFQNIFTIRNKKESC